MLDGHKVKLEQRQRPCCDNPSHRSTIAVCSCGWESEHYADAGAAIVGHRLTCIEDVLNERHREGKRLRSSGPARGTWL